jgi:hypothetical protein
MILIYSLYRKILWTDQYNQPSLPNYSKQRLMVPQIVPQFLWKKHARKPSGPGAFLGPIWKSAKLISS